MTAVVELEQRECPECGEEITGAASGRGSVGWKMGTHRRVKHGVKGTGKTGRPKKGMPTAADHAAHPVISAVQEVAAEITGTGRPTADQLTAGLGRGTTLAIGLGATWLVETDHNIPRTPEGEQARDALIDYLMIKETDAKALMRPVGRLFAPTKLNARYGRKVIDNVDILGSVAGLMTWSIHMREYLEVRREGNQLRAQELARGAVPQPGMPLAPAPVPTTAAASAFEPAAAPEQQQPGPVNGHVVTAAEVEAMQRTRGIG